MVRKHYRCTKMSQSEAVYQPTTVTYESNSPQEQWPNRPISYLASTVSQAARRPCGIPCLPNRNNLPLVLLVAFVSFFIVGLILFVNGIVNVGSSDGFYTILAVVGAIFIKLSLLLLVLFLRVSKRLCWQNSKDHMDTSGGQALTVNPSTDLLVTAQYAPVSEVVYQPPPQEDNVAEQSKLMPPENKDLSNEDTDRMVESDPRIVLRPLNQPAHEDT